MSFVGNGNKMINKFIILPTALLMLIGSAKSQQKQRIVAQDTSFVVESGTTLNDVIPLKYSYHYSEFKDGKVLFRNGKVSAAKMNYNRVMDEMHFINQNGDTLAIGNEPTVKLISIEKDSFCFDQGYIMLIKSNSGVKLGVKQGFKIRDRRKYTGYGMMSSTSSVTSLNSFYDWRPFELEVKQQVLVSTFTRFFIGDQYNHFVLASSKNLLDLFPNHATQLSKFCKEHKVDFQVKRDLEKLFDFLSTLIPPL